MARTGSTAEVFGARASPPWCARCARSRSRTRERCSGGAPDRDRSRPTLTGSASPGSRDRFRSPRPAAAELRRSSHDTTANRPQRSSNPRRMTRSPVESSSASPRSHAESAAPSRMDRGSQRVATALSRMQERDGLRSRAGGRLQLVQAERLARRSADARLVSKRPRYEARPDGEGCRRPERTGTSAEVASSSTARRLALAQLGRSPRPRAFRTSAPRNGGVAIHSWRLRLCN
jgi:hypothetical protein